MCNEQTSDRTENARLVRRRRLRLSAVEETGLSIVELGARRVTADA
jgi:hypothetical protein